MNSFWPSTQKNFEQGNCSSGYRGLRI